MYERRPDWAVVIGAAIVILFLSGGITCGIYVTGNTTSGPELSATGRVVEKLLIPGQTHFDIDGHMTSTVDEYRVTIEWPHGTTVQSSADLFERTRVGDLVTVRYVEIFWKGAHEGWDVRKVEP